MRPVCLQGSTIALVPLSMEHYEPLLDVLLDPALWRWTLHRFASNEDVSRDITTALDDASAGRVLAFVILLKDTGEVVGSTRYHSIESTDRRLEIGHTWIATRWQRTQVNTEAKYLLLRHAFEDLRFRRVQFRAAARNEPSRRAILRLGAHQEGVLREYVGLDSTEGIDVVIFSILAAEWPAVKTRLESMMARTREPTR